MPFRGWHRSCPDIPTRLAAIERGQEIILAQGAKIMLDMTNFNRSVENLKAEISDIASRMDQMFSDLQAAHNEGDQAAVDAAQQAIDAQVASLKALSDRDTLVQPPKDQPPATEPPADQSAPSDQAPSDNAPAADAPEPQPAP
jgi:outer membrane murein-binding lipoprotein Lpp